MSAFIITDFVIFAVVGISLIISFFRGIIREAISLVVWVIALMAGLKYSADLGGLIFPNMKSPEMSYILAFIIIFLFAIVIGMVVSAIVRAMLDKTGLSMLDRLLGALFGFARGVLLVAMVLMFVSMSSWKDESWITNSFAVTKMQPIVQWLNGFVPKQVGIVSKWVEKD